MRGISSCSGAPCYTVERVVASVGGRLLVNDTISVPAAAGAGGRGRGAPAAGRPRAVAVQQRHTASFEAGPSSSL